MRGILLALVSLATFWTSAVAQSTVVDAYVTKESPIAKAGLLANIGPSGSKSSGAKVSHVGTYRRMMLTMSSPAWSSPVLAPPTQTTSLPGLAMLLSS